MDNSNPYEDNSKFLEKLFKYCLSIADTLDLWIQVSHFHKDNPNFKLPDNVPKPSKKDTEAMLQILEQKADHCEEILEWFDHTINILKEQLGDFNTNNSDGDKEQLTVEEAMRLHKKLYPDEYKEGDNF